MKNLTLHTGDFRGLLSLMDHSQEYPSTLVGENEQGESITVDVQQDHITVETCQRNGAIRQNVYWRDGSIEEGFFGRWR